VDKEGVPNTYIVTIQNAAYDQEITLQFAAGFQLKAGVNNKVKWASPGLEVKSVSAIDAKTVKVVFPAAVTADITAAQFKVVQNGQEIQVSAVEKAADNLSATLTLAAALSHGDFTVNGVTGTIDLQAPKLVKASINENDRVLTLSYDEALDVNSVPAAGDFTVRVNGVPVTVLPFVDVTDKNVVLTLGNVISSGSTVVIDYKPGTKPIQDASGNKADALVLQPVTVVPPTLAAPANVQVALEPGAKAKITWDAANLAEKYRVEVSVNGGNFVPVTVITKDVSGNLGTSFEYAGNDGQSVSFKIVAVDSKGNEAASAATSAVTLDGKAPELVSAVVDGDQLVLTYNEALDEKSKPATNVFTINGSSISISVSSVAVSGDKVTLTLSGAVSSADKVTLDYNGSSIKDLAGNAAQTFTGKEVANITKLDKGTWTATGRVAYNDTRKAIYQEFKLIGLDGTTQINLDVNNVVSIEVQKPDGSVQRLTPNSDTTLWFNVLANQPGAYKFTVKTVNGATTEATLNWAGFKTVQATKTGNAGTNGVNMYTEFKLGDLNLAANSVVDVFQIKPDGTIADLTPNTDTNLWFLTGGSQQAGAHSFLAFYNQGDLGTWYKATINYPDDVLPILKGASINEETLTAEFDLNLNTSAVPSADAFTVKVNGQAVDLDSSTPVSISGKVLTLTLAKPVKVVDSVTLSYKAPSTNKLTGENGLPAKDFTDVAVTNNTSGPVLESATVNGDQLTLTFSKELDTASVPATSDFVIKVNGVKDAVSKVEVLNDTTKGKVTLTLVVPVAASQTVSASYTPGANPLKDTAGNPVAAIDEMLVQNTTP
jgi:uncharacterized repeat protein (TIGR02059 family)